MRHPRAATLHRVIKYLGSKRLLVPVLTEVATAVGATTAVDLFTGTTRVAQGLKRAGIHVTGVDVATYSKVLADCFVATDAREVDQVRLAAVVAELAALPGKDGYVTRTFCENARFIQPHNGRRIDAIRDAIEDLGDDPLRPILLTALLLAADRVDSTTGQQMAYLKDWSKRSFRDLDLRVPELLEGPGRAVLGDATLAVEMLEPVDLAYLDPPYNQHRYYTNYHVWETLIRWDEPEHYGIACKRLDARDPATKSVFNSKPRMADALRDLVERVSADVVVVSYNDEAWVEPQAMERLLRDAGHEEVAVLAFDQKRYVGAQIGIHSPHGVRTGSVSHLRNTELVFVAGPRDRVAEVARLDGVREPA